MNALLSGFGLTLSIIFAIGAQNSFILRQGLKKEHVFWICLVCSLSDLLLIVMGVLGFSVVIQKIPSLMVIIKYLGALFLFAYGLKSFWAAFKSSAMILDDEKSITSLSRNIAIALALTWLNPHVYLDTVFLIGSISTQFIGQKLEFTVGAVAASFVFFFSLGYGASLLRPIFSKPISWKILDMVIGAFMWVLAVLLLWDI
ncbi:LysE/ArgO family amino acid transporter [Aquirhabdus parva]|uniref:Amino acid transporter n=1 Tax=Aquirhabdus parva TaxID=2283318 RepID=A0A345P6J7_9GAMM|nr:LysE/ArgO family amino acid transporter [Aquirhabdus parva]AXI02906.1 amino acid transporter [Aquirhabdus parva]